mmetsp:Transcript_46355/g.105104  ORF Transcript_46355/g.105104 Transcript_46355/m.105104 type:complete len:710 (+) Transcript_46355:57-2186(+)
MFAGVADEAIEELLQRVLRSDPKVCSGLHVVKHGGSDFAVDGKRVQLQVEQPSPLEDPVLLVVDKGARVPFLEWVSREDSPAESKPAPDTKTVAPAPQPAQFSSASALLPSRSGPWLGSGGYNGSPTLVRARESMPLLRTTTAPVVVPPSSGAFPGLVSRDREQSPGSYRPPTPARQLSEVSTDVAPVAWRVRSNIPIIRTQAQSTVLSRASIPNRSVQPAAPTPPTPGTRGILSPLTPSAPWGVGSPAYSAAGVGNGVPSATNPLWWWKDQSGVLNSGVCAALSGRTVSAGNTPGRPGTAETLLPGSAPAPSAAEAGAVPLKSTGSAETLLPDSAPASSPAGDGAVPLQPTDGGTVPQPISGDTAFSSTVAPAERKQQPGTVARSSPARARPASNRGSPKSSPPAPSTTALAVPVARQVSPEIVTPTTPLRQASAPAPAKPAKCLGKPAVQTVPTATSKKVAQPRSASSRSSSRPGAGSRSPPRGGRRTPSKPPAKGDEVLSFSPEGRARSVANPPKSLATSTVVEAQLPTLQVGVAITMGDSARNKREKSQPSQVTVHEREAPDMSRSPDPSTRSAKPLTERDAIHNLQKAISKVCTKYSVQGRDQEALAAAVANCGAAAQARDEMIVRAKQDKEAAETRVQLLQDEIARAASKQLASVPEAGEGQLAAMEDKLAALWKMVDDMLMQKQRLEKQLAAALGGMSASPQ